MLTIVEEILLLMLDDEKGRFVSLPTFSTEYALAGALLMDLSLRDRIDTDPERLVVVNAEPTGDALLDSVLETLRDAPQEKKTTEWLNALAQHCHPIRERTLDRLVERGILAREEKKVLWIFGKRCYPTIDGREEREVKQRILEILESEEIPEPRDVVIIALADACALFDSILERDRLERLRPRIRQIARMDLIAQAMNEMIVEMRRAMTSLPPHQI